MKNKFINNIQKLITDKRGASGLRPYLTGLIIIVMFSVFVMMFMVNFLGANNPSSPALTDSQLNLVNNSNALNQSLADFTNNVNVAKGTLGNSTFERVTAFFFLIFQGAFTIPWSFLVVGVNTVNMFFFSIFPGLGGTFMGAALPILLGVIAAIMTITIVFLIIKAIRTGESER